MAPWDWHNHRREAVTLSNILLAYVALMAAFFFFGGRASAQSSSPVSIGSFRRWSAVTANTADGKMCFAVSQPTESTYQPDNVKSRDPAYFMLTTLPEKKIQNEVSTMIGYPFAEGSKVTVDIAGAEFALFTKDSEAWIEDPAQQPALVDAIRHGDKMTVQGTSRRGTTTIDSYSLAGSGGALKALAKECSIQ